MRIMAIDPGISGTGYAVMEKKGGLLLAHGVLRGDSGAEWHEQGDQIANNVLLVQHKWKTRKSYIEFPSLFQSAFGQMVARRGDLVKLAWLTGVLCRALEDAVLVPVNEWKGQLPKAIVNKRIVQLLGKRACADLKSHDWDATGIGLWALGRF